MNEPLKVAVVILGWNGKKFLEQFLPSVTAHTSSQLCEIIVADNCSADGSVEFVKKNYPGIRVIQNTVNEGYARGYNEALKQVTAKYYVLLNQDIEVTAHWVERVIDAMERDETIAAAQPKLRYYYERNYFEYAGACGGYLDKYGYAFCRGRMFDTMEKDEGQYDDAKEIFWATGACLFVRSEVFWQAGALDNDFFAHQEEIDLCWRIKNKGYKIVCIPSAVVYHVVGGSLPQESPHKTFLNFRNNLMTMFKNLHASEVIWKIFVVRLALDGIAAIYSVVKNRNFNDLTAILKAHFAFYAAIPKLIRKRKQIPHPSSVHLTQVSVVWQYFVKGKKKYSDCFS